MNSKGLSAKCILDNDMLICEEIEDYFKNRILKMDGETFITPDLNGDESEGSTHRITSFIDSEHVNKFCNKLNIEPNNLFLAVSSFVLSKFVYNKNLLFANSGIIDNQSFDEYLLALNLDTDLNAKSFLSQINGVWVNSIVHHDSLLQIVDEFPIQGRQICSCFEC